MTDETGGLTVGGDDVINEETIKRRTGTPLPDFYEDESYKSPKVNPLAETHSS